MDQNRSSPAVPGFQGNEFANNLLSDLAPVLTLFGEQVTKQFLSLSLGHLDSALIAVAPLGIVTIIVSAIRVSNWRWLKGIIGRARESRATVEVELLTSTSDSVCELYDGRQIVRLPGVADTHEVVYRKRRPERSDMGDVAGLVKAVRDGKLQIKGKAIPKEPLIIRALNLMKSTMRPNISCNERTKNSQLSHALEVGDQKLAKPVHRSTHGHVRHITLEVDAAEGLIMSSPNLILNMPKAVVSSKELKMWVILGCALQVLVVGIAALLTYGWDVKDAPRHRSWYGYICFALGTLTLVLGLSLCSSAIEGSSSELKFALPNTAEFEDYRILRVQRACVASEQQFTSFAIFNDETDREIRFSRPNRIDLSHIAAMGSAFSIVGFVCQFVGLRSLHWLITVLQLVAVLILTAIRVHVRRGLAHRAICEPIPVGYEDEWLSEHIYELKGFEIPTGSYDWSRRIVRRSLDLDTVYALHALSFGNFSPSPSQTLLRHTVHLGCTFEESAFKQFLQCRRELGNAAGRAESKSLIATGLIDSIERVYQLAHDVLTTRKSVVDLSSYDISFPIMYQYNDSRLRDTLSFKTAELLSCVDAMLNFWILTLKQRWKVYSVQDEDCDQYQYEKLPKGAVLRIIGTRKSLHDTMRRAIDSLGVSIYSVSSPNGSELEAESVGLFKADLPYINQGVVLGFEYSSAVENFANPASPGEASQNENEPTAKGSNDRQVESPAQKLSDIAVVVSDGSMKRQCALDLFSIFLRQFAAQMRAQLGCSGFDFSNYSRFCEILVSTGLAKNLKESYPVVLAALNSRDLVD